MVLTRLHLLVRIESALITSSCSSKVEIRQGQVEAASLVGASHSTTSFKHGMPVSTSVSVLPMLLG